MRASSIYRTKGNRNKALGDKKIHRERVREGGNEPVKE
jgi:hypothetical protein